MGRLAGKSLLVVGGGADGPAADSEKLAIGNGRATALTCAREGASVMVADIDLELAEQTVDSIAGEGHVARAVRADVLDEDACQAAVAATVEAFGSLNLLVNNVGGTDAGDVTDVAPDTFDHVMQLNVRSQFMMMRAAIPEMIRAGGGSIVNVSSVNGIRAGATVAYDASKAAVLGLMRNVAMSSGKHGIRVNSVLPGIINSAMLRRMLDGAPLDLTARIPLGRHGSPWEIGSAVAFLLSDDASFITGHELVVDGGMTTLM